MIPLTDNEYHSDVVSQFKLSEIIKTGDHVLLLEHSFPEYRPKFLHATLS